MPSAVRSGRRTRSRETVPAGSMPPRRDRRAALPRRSCLPSQIGRHASRAAVAQQTKRLRLVKPGRRTAALHRWPLREGPRPGRSGAKEERCAGFSSTRTARCSTSMRAGRTSIASSAWSWRKATRGSAAPCCVAGGMDPESGRVSAGSALAAGNTIDIARVWYPAHSRRRSCRRWSSGSTPRFYENGIRCSVPVPGLEATLAELAASRIRDGCCDQRRHGRRPARRCSRSDRPLPAACLRLRFGGAAEAGARHGLRLRRGDRRGAGGDRGDRRQHARSRDGAERRRRRRTRRAERDRHAGSARARSPTRCSTACATCRPGSGRGADEAGGSIAGLRRPCRSAARARRRDRRPGRAAPAG